MTNKYLGKKPPLIKFPEKLFREKHLIPLIAEGMNEPSTACFVSDVIKDKIVKGAEWGFQRKVTEAKAEGFKEGYEQALNDNKIIHGKDLKKFMELTKKAEAKKE